ncbi:hypothetical protein EYV94_24595 [Puteibacter caeruleilacunae]|nr:hypothetical protein EYV94_24595 [Puteibacter caeruleilacunae]
MTLKSLRSWLDKWQLNNLKINTGFLEVDLNFSEQDKEAAWEMYVELLTRISTQQLDEKHGDEKTALDSIHSIFNTTREILKKKGSSCVQFSKIAIVVLNQIVRPFTAKWHKKSEEEAFADPEECLEFRNDLTRLQIELKKYTHLLSEIAEVEDLTDLER